MAKKQANKSNKRAARREMPEAPPLPVIHDGANESTPVAYKSEKQQPKMKRQSPLHISKRKRGRIEKAESRNGMLQTKVANSEERYKLITSSRKVTEEKTGGASTATTTTTSSSVSFNRASRGLDLLRLAKKVKVGAPGMDVDSDSDDDNDNDNNDKNDDGWVDIDEDNKQDGSEHAALVAEEDIPF